MLINILKVVGIPEYPIPGVVRFVPAVPRVCAACAGELCVAGECDYLAGVAWRVVVFAVGEAGAGGQEQEMLFPAFAGFLPFACAG